MSMSQTLTTAAAVMIYSLAAQPIGAQTLPPSPAPATTSFSELARLLKPGTAIRITDASGRRTNGRLGQLSTSSLELLGTKTEINSLSGTAVARRFSEADVQSIDVSQGDSIVNGTLIGLAVGGIAGVVTGVAACSQSTSCDGPEPVGIAMLFGGLGAGLGLAADLAITRHTRVYTSGPRQKDVRVSPVLSKAGVGARVSVRF